jgi:hypothetical protein
MSAPQTPVDAARLSLLLNELRLLRRDIEREDSATSQMTIWGRRRTGVARP